MFFHENEKCPVCDKLFTEEDDIVICPICGTPHHRSCYSEIGHCINAGKHKDGFDYRENSFFTEERSAEDNQNTDDAEAKTNAENAYYSAKPENTKTICSACGAEIERSAPFCSHCGAKQQNVDYDSFRPTASFEVGGSIVDGDDTIDDKSVDDIAAVVRSNKGRFIKKFKENKRFSWNWGGFFFGAYYLFFRKMYAQGIVCMAVELIASLLTRGFFIKQITDFSQFISSNLISGANGFPDVSLMAKLSDSQLAELMKLYDAVLPAYLITMGVSIIISITVAMFADRFYRSKVFNIVDKVNNQLADGSSFNQIGMLQSGSNLSQSQMKELYLGKLGGTSISIPLIAMLAIRFITSII
ncbi:MAG: DUF2628 domain-containing protein [Clostridium sp.]|nr:DUF2628 domain-containing protein [Clostridium sp.]